MDVLAIIHLAITAIAALISITIAVAIVVIVIGFSFHEAAIHIPLVNLLT